jgi:hypothetical protein
MPYAIPLLKYKLRQLRKLERKIRPNFHPGGSPRPLIWDIFFSTKTVDNQVKYPLSKLIAMEEDEYKSVIEEFFFQVYFQSWKENGFSMEGIYDQRLLELLDLPAYVGFDEVKKRFRELAMRHHPDRGGDTEKFIELMDIYEQLTSKKN